MKRSMQGVVMVGMMAVLCAGLSACGGSRNATTTVPVATVPSGQPAPGRNYLFGDDEEGPKIISTAARNKRDAVGLGVNGFLWRASLDTLSFMPLVSADPAGGVIITDWYTAPTAQNERFKVQVYILDVNLRADAVRVNVFRQEQQANIGWVDAPVAPETKTQMENSILSRARELRNRNLDES